MITQEMHLVERVENEDGTASMVAELAVYKNGVFSHHRSRSPFTFPNTLTDEEIIEAIMQNEYSIYA